MYRLFILPLLFLGLLTATCQNPADNPQQTDDKRPSVNEDALIAKLTAELEPNPTSQDEIDRNLIINYALDSLMDIDMTDSGLYAWIVREGEGAHPGAEEYVFVHYTGQFLDGQVFDSSYKRGKVAQFKLDQVIPGWQEAMRMLKPGGKGIFLVPSKLAYGRTGYPPLIPPNKVLRFDIELFDTYKPE